MAELLFAPMEGITFSTYRRIHHEMFPGMQEYYTPFIAPDKAGTFKPKFLKELTKDSAAGLKVIPQLMVNDPDSFIITARKLRELGFDEINLNAGCPSGTVFSKHKGSGMLADPESLDRLLDAIFSAMEAEKIKVSIKTRMGIHSTEEFPQLAEIYKKYPVSKLIIHARDRDGQYKSIPDIPGFAAAIRVFCFPVSYNGNIFSESELLEAEKITGEKLPSVMLGRGIITNPALGRELSGGKRLTCDEMRAFHAALLEAYLEDGLSQTFVLERMKHLWYYMIHMFLDYKKEQKAILKAGTVPEYRTAAEILFDAGKFSSEGKFRDI